MKVLVLMICLMVFVPPATNISEVREKYPKAVDDEQITNELYGKLAQVTKEDNKTLVAYKGAVSTLMAKYAQGIKQKKEYFKAGEELIEFAIKTEPKNIEIRCIRLSVQENSPKIVRYKDNIPEDKQFLLDNHPNTSSKAVKTFVRGYVMQSSLFDQAEKQLF